MSTALAVQNGVAGVSIMHEVIVKGDLKLLSDDERARYYTEVCQSIGVNPLTKPFDYITLGEPPRLTLYATKTATDQLRTVKGVSVFKVDAETTSDGLRIVTAYARDASGREDMDLGVVNVKGLMGQHLANAYMKALTKAKRRVTLSICGLGWLDESEIEAVATAQPAYVDTATGEMLDEPDNDTTTVVDGDEAAPQSWIRRLHAVAADVGMDHEALNRFAGLDTMKGITKRQVSELVDKINALPDATVADIKAAAQAEIPNMPADADRFTRS